MSTFSHEPVLLAECLAGLNIRPEGTYLDGTVGGAGHSRAIAAGLGTGKLICIDRDETALKAAEERLQPWKDRVTLVHANFDRVPEILDDLGIHRVDGMLFDLGVSSPQLDEAERGFSYQKDAPLDMRMDRSSALTAEEIVNSWSEEELKRILWTYGEERYASRIAAAMVKARERGGVHTTLELSELIRRAMPAAALREKQHPAKRSFQAIRIAVNDELGSVERLLERAPDRLAPGGRICVISFHSLEDRLVKQAFHKRVDGCTCPKSFPVCVCGFRQTLRLVGSATAGKEELERNPRARSARLRVAERI